MEKNKIENTGILSIKRQEYIGQKRMRSKEIIETIFIRGVQNFDDYDSLNPIETKIDSNKFLTNLNRYEKRNYKYRIIVGRLLFGRIKNDGKILIITCNGLNNAHDSIAWSYTFTANIKLEQTKKRFKLGKCNSYRFR